MLGFLGTIVTATCVLFEVSKHEGVVMDQTSRELSLLLVFSCLCFVTEECAKLSVCDCGILFAKRKVVYRSSVLRIISRFV